MGIGTEQMQKIRAKAAYYTAVLLIYLFISMTIFWPITGNPEVRVVNGKSDVYQSLWNLWWVSYALFTLHTNIYFTNLLFYPVGANLVTQTLTPLAGILVAPFSRNLALSYNILFFSSFALSGLFMFFLADHIAKNKYAAFLAGLIYAFSPMHIAQSYGHLDWTIVEFIPLFVLFFLLTLREKKAVYAAGGAISFVLLTFMGDIEQGIITVVFAIVSLILFMIYEIWTKRYSVLTKRSLLLLMLMAISVLVFGALFFVPIFKGITPEVINETNALSNPVQNMLWSNNLASFFLPSYYNWVFHQISLSYYNSTYGLTYNGIVYEPDVTEKVAYIGYSVLLLLLVALYYDRKSRFSKTRFWIAVFLTFAWLSLGPYVQILNNVTSIPTLYSLYRRIPYFNIAREPGRFDIMATLALAVLAAIGLSELVKKYHEKKNAGVTLTLIFSLLVLIEYNGVPLSAQHANQSYVALSIPKAYYEIGNITGNYTMLILPALPNITSPNLYPGMEMYYQTAFKKPLIGGYTSRENETQILAIRTIPLAVSAGYLEAGEGFIYPYPIIENYTNVTLLWLGYYNVGFVGVIRQAYNLSEQESLLSYLYSVFGTPVYQSNTTAIFSTSQALQRDFGKSIVSYLAGSWLPGFAICSAPYCNTTVESAWWGSNYRGIAIYSPDATNVSVSFEALSYYLPMQVRVYENGPSTQVTILNISQSPKNYAFIVQLRKGLNELFLISGNLTMTNAYAYPYLTYGIYNITINRIKPS